MSHQRNLGYISTGHALPEQVLTNNDIAKLVDTTDEWVVERTGIRERRKLSDGEQVSDIATRAAQDALARAGLTPNDIGLVLVATFSPEKLCPPTAAIVADKLGITNRTPFMDVNTACSGFLYGVRIATALLQQMPGTKYALVIGAEACTRFTNYHDRSTCILWGDGAGAAIIGDVEPPRGILSQTLGADASGQSLIRIDGGGSLLPGSRRTPENTSDYCIRFKGAEVYKFAVRIFSEAMDEALAEAGIKPADIDLFVPHQANIRIIEGAARRYGLTEDRVFVNVDRVGNTSAASIPIAFSEAAASGRLKPGMVVGAVAFGAGLTWGASVIRW